MEIQELILYDNPEEITISIGDESSYIEFPNYQEINAEYTTSQDILVSIEGDTIVNTGNTGVQDINAIAGENLSGHRIVYLENNKAFYASNTNLECYNKVVGMTLNACIENEPVKIRTFGIVNNQNWGLTANKNYFLYDNGAISLNSQSGISQVIGFSLDNENLFIDVKLAIKRI